MMINAAGPIRQASYSSYRQTADNDQSTNQASNTPAEVSTKPDNTRSTEKSQAGSKVTGECKCCKERKYQDVSNDPGVSFKSAANVAPEAAASAVSAHEGEHVSRNQAKAESEGQEIVFQSVRLSSDICPECGKTYISGGETTTATRPKDSQPNLGQALDSYA